MEIKLDERKADGKKMNERKIDGRKIQMDRLMKEVHNRGYVETTKDQRKRQAKQVTQSNSRCKIKGNRIN